ncbi:MAG: hypothetical protein LC792_05055 [Actinobacteria bacterium]|nr:hypothetical protein [Actinomycetota bacterium]
MRSTAKKRVAALALATAGLLAAGSVAWADDSNEVNMGGNGGMGGHATSESDAVNFGNDAGTATANGGGADPATGGAGDGGTVTQTPMCGGTAGPNDAGFLTLVNAAANIPVCPAVNAPILSSADGGDSNGGTAVGGSSRSNAESTSSASANGGNGGSAGGSHKATKAKKHRSHRSHRH